jgi:hypothetical protein
VTCTLADPLCAGTGPHLRRDLCHISCTDRPELWRGNTSARPCFASAFGRAVFVLSTAHVTVTYSALLPSGRWIFILRPRSA